ncbi:hypothetical protein QAD02_008276 [Eretmocerus hayati]|uniref:Uncharacterized protein n=1 Tax=Eretmocerus hayati TaxID=131215 RepID=A0ACC2N6E9_9HYME|nr:hypothetical protein QAD02_008276 [Eretmocerus hayati]
MENAVPQNYDIVPILEHNLLKIIIFELKVGIQTTTSQQLPLPCTVCRLSKGLQAPTCVVPKGRVFFQTSNQLQPSTLISTSAIDTVSGISDSSRTTAPFPVPANNTIWNCHQSVPYNHLQTEAKNSDPIEDPHDPSNGAQSTGSVPLVAKTARLCSSRRSATFATFAPSSSLSNEVQSS